MYLIHYWYKGILMADLVELGSPLDEKIAKGIESGTYKLESLEEVDECPHECKAFNAVELLHGDCDYCFGGLLHCQLCGKEWQEHERWCPEDPEPGYIGVYTWKNFSPKNREITRTNFKVIMPSKNPKVWVIYHPKREEASDAEIKEGKDIVDSLDDVLQLSVRWAEAGFFANFNFSRDNLE